MAVGAVVAVVVAQDAVCMNGVASWAVFLDNATMLDTVHTYFKSGAVSPTSTADSRPQQMV